MKQVVQHYKDLLPSLGLYVGEGNIIRMGGGEMGKLSDFLVKDREVYLPVDEALKDANFKQKVAFNPLAENILKRRSPMLTSIQGSIVTRLFTVGYLLITTVLHAAAQQKNGTLKSTNPDLLKFLVGLEDVTDDTGKFFSALAEQMQTKDPTRVLFNVYLKHGGQLKGEKYSRICSITSPLVKALEEAQVRGAAKSGGLEVWGVSPKRKMDVGILLRVVKTVFPLIETEGYTVGSNDPNAPYFDALLHSIQLLNKDIRYATSQLASMEPCKSAVDYLMVNDDVIDNMDDIAILSNQILVTEFNDGDGFIDGDHRNQIADVHHRPQAAAQSYVHEQKIQNNSISGAPAQNKTIEDMKHLIRPIERIPGTRQAIIDIPQEEYRTVQDERRRPSRYERGGSYEPASRGFSHPTQAPTSPYGSAPRTFDLERQLDDALERLQELEDERRRSSRGRGYSTRYDDDYEEDRYGSRRRSGRPVPRAVTDDRRSRRDEDRYGRDRGGDRFGRRR